MNNASHLVQRLLSSTLLGVLVVAPLGGADAGAIANNPRPLAETANSSLPSLSVLPVDARAGELVGLQASNCPPPSPDYSLRGNYGIPPYNSSLRFPVYARGDRVLATYRLPVQSPSSKTLLEITCSLAGNAVETISVGRGLAGKIGQDGATGITRDGNSLWIDSSGSSSILKIDAMSGKLELEIRNHDGDLTSSLGMALFRGSIWSVNAGDNSVSEFNANDGHLERLVRGAAYRFNQPDAIAVVSGQIWIANEYGNSLTVLNPTTGGLIRQLSGYIFHLGAPDALASCVIRAISYTHFGPFRTAVSEFSYTPTQGHLTSA